MRSFLLVLCSLFVACKGSGAVDGLLTRYAKADAGDTNGYIAFYAQGLKLNPKTQLPGKMRAFFLAAMLEPDLKNPCAQWDCILSGVKGLKENRRSPLFPYAAYHLADLAEKQNLFNEALQILSLEYPTLPALKNIGL